MQVKLKMVRLAFPKLWTAKPVGNGDGKYFSLALPIEPDSDNHNALEAAIAAVAKEKWGEKWKAVLAKIRDEKKCGYSHKPASNEEGEVFDGFEGMFTVNASRPENKGRPALFDSVLDPETGKVRALTEDNGRLYAGCYVNVTVDVWAQDNSYGRRINVQLTGVQFAKDGDAFSGGTKATADDFDVIEDGADADTLG